MKFWIKFRFAGCLLAVLLVTCIPALAESEAEILDDVSQSVETGVDVVPTVEITDYPDDRIVHVEALEGDADLNTLAVVTMFGFGSVCGLLAVSEVVRKWTL